MSSRRSIVLALTLCLALWATAAACASGGEKLLVIEPVGPMPALMHHEKPFGEMTLPQLERFQARALARYRYVFRHYLEWRRVHYRSTTGVVMTLHVKHVRCSAVNVLMPPRYCWYAKAAEWTEPLLAKTRAQLEVIRIREATPADCRGGASQEACAWYFDGATQCEVSYEGGWTSVSPDGTYAGRFQMDSSFEAETTFGAAMQRALGRANNWPSWAQIQHAYEVWSYAGWGRWPPYYVHGCSAYAGGSFQV